MPLADDQLKQVAKRVEVLKIYLYPPYDDTWSLKLDVKPILFEVIVVKRLYNSEIRYDVDGVSCAWWPDRLKLRTRGGKTTPKTKDNLSQILETLQKGLEEKVFPAPVIGLRDRHIFDAVKYAPHR
jgi:hypothetical protein